jgi:hypothetical protein
MRITNDEYGPIEVLAELFSYERLRKADTAQFMREDWCNHDWLLQRLQERIDTVLESYRRLGCDIYETQSLRDHGVDLRFRLDFKGKCRTIGIQVKANNEAERDRKRAKGTETLAGTLKRQAYEAMIKGAVDEWWVILCFDKTKHARRISSICAELLGDPTRFPVTIWQPEKALSLLRLSDEEVDAVCTRLLCRDDEVLKAALNEAEDLSSAALEVILCTLDDALHGEIFFESRELRNLANGEEVHEELSVVEELEYCGYIAWSSDRAQYVVEPGSMPGLCALYFEGRVRHNLSRSSAGVFVARLVRS